MASLTPELITTIGGFPITNSLIGTIVIDGVLVLGVVLISKNIKKVPSKFQSIAEIAVSYFYDLTCGLIPDHKRSMSVFTWSFSFFLVIFFSNALGLLPGVGSIGFFHTVEGKKEFIPLLRAATSDFNYTLALAFVSLIVTHILSIKYTGIKDYLSRFFSPNPVLLFVGILELISEFVKMVSLSFRLFGNIYAGEVVLSTISTLFAFLAPIPFLLLETIVALVQALVFSMLTLVFMSIFVTPHHAEEGGVH